MSNFAVISEEEAQLFQSLKTFYKEVCELTINHDVMYPAGDTDVEQGTAIVYPAKLGAALDKVNPKWFVDAFTFKNTP